MLHRCDVQGIPVFWAEGPAPLSATLTFRVGVRDETFRTLGITHLIEHLVMSTLGRKRHDYNAAVDLTYTEFTATGRPDQVSSYLGEICQALAQLPVERIVTEAKVLDAEGAGATHPAVGEHLRERYGLWSLGLAGIAPPPALDQIDADTVREFAARHFTLDNAALALTGPPPDELRLELPRGVPSELTLVPQLDLPLPMWFELGGPAVALSFLIEAATPSAREAVLTTLRISLDRAMDQLRHTNGWLYHVDFSLIRYAGDVTIVCFYADPPATHADDVRRGLLQILRDLRDVGPTPEELAEDCEALRERLDDPRAAGDEASSAAAGHLVGHPALDRAERLDLRERITAGDCRDVLRRLDETLVVGMPPDVPPDDESLQPQPRFSASRVSGKSFARKWLGAGRTALPRGARLIVGDEGVTAQLREGAYTVRWNELVGAGRDGTTLSLIGGDGFMVTVDPRWFRRGAEAMATIEAKIPPALGFTQRPDDC